MLTRLGIFFIRLVSFLPLQILYIFSDLLFVVLYHVVKYRRQVVSENLRNAFPEKTEDDRKLIERQYYHYLGDLIVETVKMITISEKEIKERFNFINPELLDRYFEQNRSVIAAAGHYGNWEMASNIGLFFDKKVFVVYKPLTDKTYDDFLKAVRSRFKSDMVPMKAAFKKILSYRREQTVSILIGDQTPARVDGHYFTQFLNQPTAVFLGIEKMAVAYNYPVVFCDVKVVKRGYYNCEFVPLTDNPKECAEYEITKAHVQYLEGMIREAPQYWIWSHRRWKLKPS